MTTIKYGKDVNIQTQKTVRSTETKTIGLAYPLESISRGYVRQQSGRELLRSNLTQLLKTSRGERVMLPQFGTNLADYLFEPLDSDTAEEIRDHILETLALFAPNVTVSKLIINESEGVTYEGYQGLNIYLEVIEKDTNQRVDLGVQIG